MEVADLPESASCDSSGAVRFYVHHCDYTMDCSGTHVLMSGTTDEGESGMVGAVGFSPYFYIVADDNVLGLFPSEDALQEWLGEQMYVSRCAMENEPRPAETASESVPKPGDIPTGLRGVLPVWLETGRGVLSVETCYRFLFECGVEMPQMQEEPSRVWRVTVRYPSLVPTSKALLYRAFRGDQRPLPSLCECNVEFYVRFLSDNHLASETWVTFPRRRILSYDYAEYCETKRVEYEVERGNPHNSFLSPAAYARRAREMQARPVGRFSRCQHEMVVPYTEIRQLSEDESKACSYKPSILCFDIETTSKDPCEPGAEVFLVCNKFQKGKSVFTVAIINRPVYDAETTGEMLLPAEAASPEDREDMARRAAAVGVAFDGGTGTFPSQSETLVRGTYYGRNYMGPVDIVEYVEDERALLLRWSEWIVLCDPHKLTGWNILNFDMYYMWERARVHEIVGGFGRISRHRHRVTRQGRQTVFRTRAHGKHEIREFSVPGLDVVDAFQVVKRDGSLKLSSYSLNSVAGHVLGEQKDDIHYSQFPEMLKTCYGRMILVHYCDKDCDLPLKIIKKLGYLPAWAAHCSSKRINPDDFCRKGLQFQVFPSIVWTSNNDDENPVPTIVMTPWKESVVDEADGTLAEDPDDSFTGGFVLEGPPGGRAIGIEQQKAATLHEIQRLAVATLDFSSLYPSIIMRGNFCPTTCVSLDLIRKHGWRENRDYITVPIEPEDRQHGRVIRFVRTRHRTGVIPRVSAYFIAMRKRCKKVMEAAEEEVERLGYLLRPVEGLCVPETLDELHRERAAAANGDPTSKRTQETIDLCDARIRDLDALRARHEAGESYDAIRDELRREIEVQSATAEKMDALQKAFKVSGNSVYGMIGARKGRLMISVIAEAVTAIGRRLCMFVRDSIRLRYNQVPEVARDDLLRLVETYERLERETDMFYPPSMTCVPPPPWYAELAALAGRYFGAWNVSKDVVTNLDLRPSDFAEALARRGWDQLQSVESVYGDTDSVFFEEHGLTPREAIDWGKECAYYCTRRIMRIFLDPDEIELIDSEARMQKAVASGVDPLPPAAADAVVAHARRLWAFLGRDPRAVDAEVAGGVTQAFVREVRVLSESARYGDYNVVKLEFEKVFIRLLLPFRMEKNKKEERQVRAKYNHVIDEFFSNGAETSVASTEAQREAKRKRGHDEAMSEFGGSKKRYAGCLWADINTGYILFIRGNEAVRRDTFELLRRMMRTVTNMLVMDPRGERVDEEWDDPETGELCCRRVTIAGEVQPEYSFGLAWVDENAHVSPTRVEKSKTPAGQRSDEVWEDPETQRVVARRVTIGGIEKGELSFGLGWYAEHGKDVPPTRRRTSIEDPVRDAKQYVIDMFQKMYRSETPFQQHILTRGLSRSVDEYKDSTDDGSSSSSSSSSSSARKRPAEEEEEAPGDSLCETEKRAKTCNALSALRNPTKKDFARPEKPRKVGKQAHVCLVQRKGGEEVGSRVSYIIADLGKGKHIKIGDKAFDPVRALEEGRDIDWDWYAERLESSLTRIMVPVYGRDQVERIFAEAKLARKKHVSFGVFATSDGYNQDTNVSVFRHFRRSSVARGSEDDEETVRERDNTLLERAETEARRGKKASLVLDSLFAKCRACIGHGETEPLACKNNDCPIFFERYVQMTTIKRSKEKIEDMKKDSVRVAEWASTLDW